MEASSARIVRYCNQHKEEPILRVSLNPKSNKLFYCHECLDELDKDAQSKLVKFNDVIDTLHTQLAGTSTVVADNAIEGAEKDINNLKVDKNQLMVKLGGFISHQKEIVDEEFNQLQEHLISVLKASRENIYGNLDAVKETFKNGITEYSEKVGNISNIRSAGNRTISKEDLYKDLTGEESVENIEKKVRQMLDRIETTKEMKSGRAEKTLTEKKTSLEGVLKSSDLITKKTDQYYKERVEALGGYLEALVFAHENVNKTELKLSSQHKQALEQIKDSIKSLDEALAEKAKKVSSEVKELFTLPVAECSLIQNGIKEVEADRYLCETCFEALGILKDNFDGKPPMFCRACIAACHAGHKVVLLHKDLFPGKVAFVCSCAFVTPNTCKFLSTCTYQYTGSNPVLTQRYKCKTDNMESSATICYLCKITCHQGHEVKEKGLVNGGYCMCSTTYSFCKFKQEVKKNESPAPVPVPASSE